MRLLMNLIRKWRLQVKDSISNKTAKNVSCPSKTQFAAATLIFPELRMIELPSSFHIAAVNRSLAIYRSVPDNVIGNRKLNNREKIMNKNKE